jgi:hypothetical protein
MMLVIRAGYGRFILVNQCIAAMQQKHDTGLTRGRRKGPRQATFGGVSRQTTQESCFGGNPYGVEAAGTGR